VVAAGGVADGRGLAAALMLGAEGVLVGTRFLATDEAPVPSAWKAAICASTEVDTVYTRIANLVARPTWAPVAPSRVLRTGAVRAWLGREAELEGLPAEERATIAAHWARARSEGRTDDMEIIAGQDCGLIHEILPVAEVVRRIVTEAEHVLERRGSAGITPPPACRPRG
jgi:nitronate monooxygenase